MSILMDEKTPYWIELGKYDVDNTEAIESVKKYADRVRRDFNTGKTMQSGVTVFKRENR